MGTLIGGAAGAVGGGGVVAGGVGRAATAGTSIPGGIGGFAHGGSFTVGGSGGTDQTPVSFPATRGEEVTVTPPGGSNQRTMVFNFNFPPGTNVREFGENQSQIAAMVANTMAAASASNN